MRMLSWNSRSNKPLKVPSDSISEGLIFQNFLGHALNLVLFNQIYIIVLQCACCLGISSRSNKPLKVPSNSISEGLIFQNFLGGHAPRPPRFGMLCMPDRVLRTQLSCSLKCIYAPPFVNPGSTPGTSEQSEGRRTDN